MLRAVRTEEIYDAAIDDEAFAGLAARMAEAIGARSGVIHWRNSDEVTEEISYSGYFSAEAMDAFDRDFADADLWSTELNRQDRANRIWDCEQLVPASVYEASVIYNEWIRPMGDDTSRCLGVVLRTPSIAGDIGFHRGKGQPSFDRDSVRRLEEDLSHVRRMISIRSKLLAADRQRRAARAATDLSVHAVLTLNPEGRLLHANPAAEELLSRGDALTVRRHRLSACLPEDQKALQAAIARAAAAQGTEASGLWLHRESGLPYELSVASANRGGLGRHIILVVSDRESHGTGAHARLKALYGLTHAEAEIALHLAEGVSTAEVAETRGASVHTVRTQIKAIMGKLGCSSQSQLVAKIRTAPRFRDKL